VASLSFGASGTFAAASEVSASFSHTITVTVGEQLGEQLNHSIHVGSRLLGYTNSLAARRYRR
jgi:hypothetical protein